MATASTGSDWLRRFHPAPVARTRLVCFPHAGGSATFYRPVSYGLSPDVEVLAVQYPGRQDRRSESCIEDIHVLADLIVEQLWTWVDRPITLFGHSMGATIAFEVAGRLESRGVLPLGLFASGRPAPSRGREGQLHLSDDRELIGELQRQGGTEAELLADEAIVQMLLPAVRSDYRAIETYRFRGGPKLSCPMSVLIGDSDSQVSISEAMDWERHTDGPFELKVFSGGHFFLTEHADEIIRQVGNHIRNADLGQ